MRTKEEALAAAAKSFAENFHVTLNVARRTIEADNLALVEQDDAGGFFFVWSDSILNYL